MLHVFSENLFAFFASKNNLHGSENFMIFSLSMAHGAVKPFLAALSSYLHLGIQNMLAHL